MPVRQSLEMVFPLGCGCCRPGNGGDEGFFECYGEYDKNIIFTARELEVLKSIRDSGAKARSIKKRIRQAATGEMVSKEDLEGAEKELEDLRRKRAGLEEARIAAWEERMRFLGHL